LCRRAHITTVNGRVPPASGERGFKKLSAVPPRCWEFFLILNIPLTRTYCFIYYFWIMKNKTEIKIERESEDTGFFTRPFILTFYSNRFVKEDTNEEVIDFGYEIGSFWICLFFISIISFILYKILF